MPYPTRERLNELLKYDPETGEFEWAVNVNHRRMKGSKAGRLDKDGYLIIGVDYRPWRAHRLAFVIMTGEPPAGEVDHVDGRRDNNAWSNLRDVTRQENSQNLHRTRTRTRHALPPGVMPRNNRFIASIQRNGKPAYLGMFKTAEAAGAAYAAAKEEMRQSSMLKHPVSPCNKHGQAGE